jgi:hypothetical protein
MPPELNNAVGGTSFPLGPAPMGVRCGRGVLVGGYVGVAANAVIVAKTAADVSRVSGVGDGPAVGVCVIVGVSVGVRVMVAVTRGVVVATDEGVTGEINGGTSCPHPAQKAVTITATRDAAAFLL